MTKDLNTLLIIAEEKADMADGSLTIKRFKTHWEISSPTFDFSTPFQSLEEALTNYIMFV